MFFSENDLINFSEPLSKTEEQKCINAIEMMRKALKSFGFTDKNLPIKKMINETYSFFLEMEKSDSQIIGNTRKIKIFVQGSYANDTNVKINSDVDVAVILESSFRGKYRNSILKENYGFINSEVTSEIFKDEVEIALKNTFKKDVERKNKSIKIHGNSYRVDADSVPCLRYRDYSKDFSFNSDNFIGGILIRADDGEEIINFPEQHIRLGKIKNSETNGYYKKLVRIIKKIRYLMREEGIRSCEKVNSFGIESLLWNIPNSIFNDSDTFSSTLSQILLYLMQNSESFSEYHEANGIKLLICDEDMLANYHKFLVALVSFILKGAVSYEK